MSGAPSTEGLSWSGLNDSLPNLPVSAPDAVAGNGRGARLLLEDLGEIEWAPGEKTGLAARFAYDAQREEALKRALSSTLAAEILSSAAGGDFLYAGASDGGRIWASWDRGATWRVFTRPKRGRPRHLCGVREPTGRPGGRRARGGRRSRTPDYQWRDLLGRSNGGPAGMAAHAVTADYSSGAVYVASDKGVFLTFVDLLSAGPPGLWTPLTTGLTNRAVLDVRLDAGGNQLYIAVEGEGVFAATAPHRFWIRRLVSAADFNRGRRPLARCSAYSAGMYSTARAGNSESAGAGGFALRIADPGSF